MAKAEFKPMDETPEEFMMSQVFGIEVTQEQLDARRKKKVFQVIPESPWEKDWKETEVIIFGKDKK